MEFLDPVAKKNKTRRIFIGYGLVTVLIALATYIMVATAVGYEVFDFSDDVVRNGLVIVDSKPVAASIAVNGKLEADKTKSKLALNGGEYTITLNEPGYTSWSKKISIEGGRVRIINYPWLFPTILTSTKLADLPVDIGFSTQSPDSRWLIVQQSSSLPAIEIFDLESTVITASSVVLPPNVVTSVAGKYGSFEALGWADDNRHFMLLQKLPDGEKAYLLIDRENLDLSVNLSSIFGVEPTSVSFFDNRADKFYMYFATGGLIRVADLAARNIGATVLDQVLSYESFGSDLVLYTTTKDAQSGTVAAKIYEDGQSYALAELAFDSNNHYFLEFHKFEGSWYYTIGSGSSDRVQIFRNPLNFIASEDKKPASPLLTLKTGTPEIIHSSPGSKRFTLVRSGQSVTVFDAEEDNIFKYDLPFTADAGATLTWADAFHLQTVAGGKLQVFEFDGQNNREFLSVRGITIGYFSKNLKKLFSISPTDTGSTLYSTSLIVF